MLELQISSRKTQIGLTIAALAATSVLLAGCSKQTADVTAPGTAIQTNTSETTPTTGTSNDAAGASPIIKAETTTKAATNEETELNALNKDSTSVDQGFNDQAITVN